MSEIVLTRRALKDLDQLDRPIRKRIIEKLNELSADPTAYGSRLTDSRLGSFRFRIGDWRVVFDITDDRIIVLRIGHRREIYR
jgi:mRNA interferase RelE/StbE